MNGKITVTWKFLHTHTTYPATVGASLTYSFISANADTTHCFSVTISATTTKTHCISASYNASHYHSDYNCQ